MTKLTSNTSTGVRFVRRQNYVPSNFSSARRFRTTYLPTTGSTSVAAAFIRRLGYNRRHYDLSSGSIDSHKGQIRGTDVMPLFRTIILHPNFDAYLHRGVKGAIDRRAQNYEVSDANGHEKVEVIDRS